MLELPLICLAGLLGSAHCLGMCGPFALSIGAGATLRSAAVQRQLAYSAGRLTTYAFLGAVAGFAGWRLTKNAPHLVNGAALLAIAAGAALMLQGLFAAKVLPAPTFTARLTGSSNCPSRWLFAGFLSSSGRLGVYLAGLATGFLPCGLLYSFVALAASSRDMLRGAMMLIAFGLGTAPLMIALGLGGASLSLAGRKRLVVAAAWCLVITGVITIVRGIGYFSLAAESPPDCPFCR